MEEAKVNYFDENANLLFHEQLDYSKIPPIGRTIIWSATYWSISQIVENWDKNIVIVTMNHEK